MKQTSELTRNLAAAQERHADLHRIDSGSYRQAIEYRIYTEAKGDIAGLVTRYFKGATLYYGLGLWQGSSEDSVTILVIGTLADLQAVTFLAGDIKTVNQQTSVLVTWARVGSLEV